MRKTLFLGALALLASTTLASAATTTVALDGFCNAYTIHNSHGVMAAKDTPSCGGGFGGGLLATIHGQGKNAIIALQDPASSGVQFEFTFSYPFVTGGTWSLYETSDGVHFSLLTSGNYTVTSPGGDRGSKETKSVTAP